MTMTTKELFCSTFMGFPDVLDVNQVSSILHISTKTVYRLINTSTLQSIKVGRAFRVPKVCLMKYMRMIDFVPTIEYTEKHDNNCTQHF